MLKMMPVARRALGYNETTLRLTCCLRGRSTRTRRHALRSPRGKRSTLEDGTDRPARARRRHPVHKGIELHLRTARLALAPANQALPKI